MLPEVYNQSYVCHFHLHSSALTTPLVAKLTWYHCTDRQSTLGSESACFTRPWSMTLGCTTWVNTCCTVCPACLLVLVISMWPIDAGWFRCLLNTAAAAFLASLRIGTALSAPTQWHCWQAARGKNCLPDLGHSGLHFEQKSLTPTFVPLPCNSKFSGTHGNHEIQTFWGPTPQDRVKSAPTV